MSSPGVDPAAAVGFGNNADDYERSRPGYPAEAVACIVARAGVMPGRRVVDLAAGTGKLTRALVPTGAEVVAVEPVVAMRTVLERSVPGVTVVDGTAESLPLEDTSVDAITVAQAFHWFDRAAALDEMHRVLRPGGTVVLVWNTRDRDVEWVRAFGDLLVDGDRPRPYDSYDDVDWAQVVAASGHFTELQRYSVTWSQPFDADLLVARAASVSVVGALGDAERVVVLDRVRRLAAEHPDLAGRPTFPFPYTTNVFWCHRR